MEPQSDAEGDTASRRLVRERPEDFVAGWFFPIPMPAFRAALDIERTERAETTKEADGAKQRRTWHEWTQRAKPAWAFDRGDVFHAPAVAPGPWAEQLGTLRWTVQVREVRDRTVTIAMTEHREARTTEHDVSMDDLALLLRTGRLEGTFDFAGENPS